LAKRFEYAAALAEDGRLLADGADPLEPGETWTPEHLVLAGLMRCTLESLAFHAERSGVSSRGSAHSEAVVARREEDGRFAFLEVECALDVELDPAPEGSELAELLALAERDCFVGASLAATPRYQWSVNGEAVP
jgi:organic hydroperoxide reductase OsmC/OhrA